MEMSLLAFHKFVKSALHAQDADDRAIAEPLVAYWMSPDRHAETPQTNESVVSGSLVSAGSLRSRVFQLAARLLWASYGSSEDRLSLLSYLVHPGGRPATSPQHALAAIRLAQTALTSPSTTGTTTSALDHLPGIRDAYADDPSIFNDLDAVIDDVLRGNLPLGHDGLPVSDSSLAEMCSQASSRWRRRLDQAPVLAALPDLSQSHSPAQLGMIKSLLYQDHAARQAVIDAVATGGLSSTSDIRALAGVLHALCDASAAHGEIVQLGHHADDLFERVARLAVDYEEPDGSRALAASCVVCMYEAGEAHRETFTSRLSKAVGRVPVDRLTSQTVAIAAAVKLLDSRINKSLVGQVVEHGLKWIVRYYAEDLRQTADSVAAIDGLGT
jgi:hypothetical protein